MERLQAVLDVVYRDVVDPVLYLLDEGAVVPRHDQVAVEAHKALDRAVNDRDAFAEELIKPRVHLAGDVVGEIGGVNALAVTGAQLPVGEAGNGRGRKVLAAKEGMWKRRGGEDWLGSFRRCRGALEILTS